ncbi:hypothetical protein CEXT_645301 [Caerostris extrusa]|uniref:Transposase n=1 Tax=Caerostris extrusa TaxID=172846 RepID=A0AAV4SHA6_CAEEX|nr:hypothetical protein CEXT_645301 [Caerostris extrusa]
MSFLRCQGLAEYAPSNSMVKFWIVEFKHGCKSISEEECPGCPIEVTPPEAFDKIHIILDVRKLKVFEIAEATSI